MTFKNMFKLAHAQKGYLIKKFVTTKKHKKLSFSTRFSL